MSQHLKTRVINRLKSTFASFEQLPAVSAPHSRGVRYFRVCETLNALSGAMDSVAEGRKYKKRIVVRPSRFRKGLFELYTYHFPKHWSAACVANRELIKEAQRLAHAVERDHSLAALEWRVKFLHQLYTLPVWYKGKGNVPVEKRRYPHFYSYVFATIYCALRAEAKGEDVKKELTQEQTQTQTQENVTFEPVLLNNPARTRVISRRLVIKCQKQEKRLKNEFFFKNIWSCQKKAVLLHAFSSERGLSMLNSLGT